MYTSIFGTQSGFNLETVLLSFWAFRLHSKIKEALYVRKTTWWRGSIWIQVQMSSVGSVVSRTEWRLGVTEFNSPGSSSLKSFNLSVNRSLLLTVFSLRISGIFFFCPFSVLMKWSPNNKMVKQCMFLDYEINTAPNS